MGIRHFSFSKLIQVACCVLSLCMGLQVVAQPPEPPRDRFFNAMRDAQHRFSTGRREFSGLLRHESVRAEIGLSEEANKTLQAFNDESWQQMLQIRDNFLAADNALTVDELVEKLVENQSLFDKKYFDFLAKNADFERLIVIYAQARRYRAATNEEVAKRIGMSDVELAEYRKCRGEIWHELMDETRDRVGKYIREGKRSKIEGLFKQAEERLNEKLATKLTDEQKSHLEAYFKDDPFELPEQPIDFRVGPPRRGSSNEDERRQRPSDNCCNNSAAFATIAD